ncbi:MAG: hypothetical protein JWQ85_4099 [Mucilaginibacter sp.]|nr:hypothetical protein [Mucilaginibacter sp.]
MSFKTKSGSEDTATRYIIVVAFYPPKHSPLFRTYYTAYERYYQPF